MKEEQHCKKNSVAKMRMHEICQRLDFMKRKQRIKGNINDILMSPTRCPLKSQESQPSVLAPTGPGKGESTSSASRCCSSSTHYCCILLAICCFRRCVGLDDPKKMIPRQLLRMKMKRHAMTMTTSRRKMKGRS